MVLHKKYMALSMACLMTILGATLLWQVEEPADETVNHRQAMQSFAPYANDGTEKSNIDIETGKRIESAPVQATEVDFSNVIISTKTDDSMYDRWLRGELDLDENDGILSDVEMQALREQSLNAPYDPSVQILPETSAFPPSFVSGFDSMDYNDGGGSVPPDPEMAAGPSHVIAVVNVAVAIYDKTGTAVLGPTAAGNLFSQSPCTGGLYDPNVLYDEEAGRWIIAFDQGAAQATGGYCLLASQSADPLGSWNEYFFPTNASNGGVFTDYPHAGVGDNYIFMGANIFNLAGTAFIEGKIFAFNKADLYAGNPVTMIEQGLGNTLDTPQPVNLHGASDGTWPAWGNTHYFMAEPFDATNYTLLEWDPTGSLVNHGDISIGTGSQPIASIQDGTTTLAGNDARPQDFEYRNGYGWTTMTNGCNPGAGTVNCVTWAQVDLMNVTNPPTLGPAGSGTFGSDGEYRSFPDLAVNRCGDMVVGYTKSSASTFPSVWFTGRQEGDPAGTLQAETLAKAGEIEYVSFQGSGTPNRWGDYTGMTIDPDGETFWYLGEYSKDTGTTNGRWGNYISAIVYNTCNEGGPATGTIEGTVTDVDSGLGIAGASVSASGSGIGSTTTAGDGSYSLTVITGTYTVTFSANNYESVVVNNVDVLSGTVTTVNASLGGAVLSYAPSEIEEFMEVGDIVTNTVTVTNTGSVTLTFDAQIGGFGGAGSAIQLIPVSTESLDPASAESAEFAPRTTKQPLATIPVAVGDLLHSIDAETTSGSILLLGVEKIGSTYYVSAAGLAANSETNYVFLIDESGTLLDTWTQPTSSVWGWRDFAYDGEYLYASDSAVIEQIDPSTGVPTGVTIPSPENPGRALAYDPVSDTFWVQNFGSSLYNIDRSGNVLATYTNGLSAYGLAWDDQSPGGPFLWIWSQDGTIGHLATQIDPTTGVATGVSFEGSSDFGTTGSAGGATIGGYEGQAVFIGMHQATPDTIALYDLDAPYTGGTSVWATAVPNSGTVPPNSVTTFEVIFNATGLVELGTYTAELTFDGNFNNSVPTMPLTMHLSCPTCGVLAGDVTDAFTNDPLTADIHITNDSTDIMLSTSSYSVGLPAGVYEINASASGYISQTVIVTATTGITTVTDFALDPIVRIMEVSVSEMEETVGLGSVTTRTITLSNSGTVALDYNLGDEVLSSPAVQAIEALVCNSPNVAIPDNDPTGASDSLTLIGGTANDLQVHVNASHTWVGDMIMTLTNENTGTAITIYDRPGYVDTGFGCGGDNLDIILSDDSLLPVEDSCQEADPAFTTGEAYSPNNPLSGFNGEALAGTWTLNITDNASQDTGTFNSWCIDTGAEDAVWLTQSPISGTLEAGESVMVDIAFNSIVVTQTGTYEAFMSVTGNFDNVVAPITTTMHVTEAVAGITLDVTVNTENSCGTESSISVDNNTTVFYCYTVTNTGNVMLPNHTIHDSVFGEINTIVHELQPGDSASVIYPQTVTGATSSTVTWTASHDGLGMSAEAMNTVEVTLNEIFIYLPFIATP